MPKENLALAKQNYATAISFYSRELYEKALEYFKKACPVLHEEGNYRQAGICNRMIAICYGRMKNRKKEIQYTEIALEYAEEHKLSTEMAKIHHSCSISNYHNKNFTESLKHAEMAIKYLPERNSSKPDSDLRESCIASKCISLVRLGYLGDAEKLANDCLDTFSYEPAKNLLRQCLARIYNKTGRKERALKIVDFLIDISGRPDATLHLLRVEALGDGKEVAPDIMKAVKAEEKKLINIERSTHRRVYAEENASNSVIARAIDQFVSRGMLDEAFAIVRKIKSRDFTTKLPWDKKYASSPENLLKKGYALKKIKEIQELLQEGEACLDIYVEDDCTLLFMIMKTSHHFENVIITEGEIKELIEEIIYAVLHKETAFLHKEFMAELFERVFSRAFASLNGEQKLIIIPHRYFHDLSFAGFGLGLDISYLPNLPTLKLLRNAEYKYKKCLILGDPDSDLPKAVTESRAVALHYAKQANLFLKNDATVENLEKFAGTVDVIHMACHAQYNECDPSLSCVFLRNKDGERWPLITPQIAQMLLGNVSLVVLSSCESGRGRIAGLSDELVSVPRAFLIAGAKGVLVTFGKVQDHNATHDLMDEFHKQLTTGTIPARALRLAQEKVCRQHPHPYFWAGFQYIGI